MRLDNHRRRLDKLQQVIAGIASAPSTDQAIQQAVSGLSELDSGATAYFGRVSPEQRLTLACSQGPHAQRSQAGLEFDLNDLAPHEAAVASGEAFQTRDVGRDPELRAFAALLAGDRATSLLYVLVRSAGEVVGVVGYAAPRRRRWNRATVSAVELLSEALAMAIKEERLEQERERITEELADETRLLEQIASRGPLEDFLEALAQSVEAWIDGARCSICRFDDPAQELVLSASPSYPDDLKEALTELYSAQADSPVVRARNRAERVIVVNRDFVDSPDGPPDGLAGDPRSSWFEPITSSDGRVMGLVVVNLRHVGRPTDYDLHRLETVTRLAAIAIGNAEADREERRLREAITAAATDWQMTFDAVETAILVVDMRGTIRRMNRTAKDLLGGTYTDNLERRIQEVGTREPWLATPDMIAHCRDKGVSTTRRVTDPQAGRSWDVTASLFGGPDPREERIIVMALDVTAITRMEESLRLSEEMSNLGTLLAGVVHEVRNPLFGITATLDALEAECDSHMRPVEHLEVLREQVDRITRLTRDLLAYGRPCDLRIVPTSIAEVVERAVEECGALAARSDVEIELRPLPEDASLPMDKGRMHLALKNLLDNAIQHTPEGGRVVIAGRLSTRSGQPGVECSIEDSGPGLQEEDLGKVFEPFFSRRPGGAGLGLAIVRRTIEGHGGWIEARNGPAGGARFALWLPLASAATEPGVPTSQ